MGIDPEDEGNINPPINPEVDLCEDARLALMIFNMLPDLVEGMSGTWLGKNFSGIGDIFRFYDIDNEREVFDYIMVCVGEASRQYDIRQKAASQMKGSGGSYTMG